MTATDRILIELNSFIQTYATTAELVAKQSLDSTNISTTQGHLLMLLAKQPQTNRDLAQTMYLSKPAITKALKSLTSQGYITGQASQTDKRQIEFQLTQTGVALAHRHLQAHTEMHQAIDQALNQFDTNQQNTIQEFLTQMNAIARKDPS
ncbi:MarR family winged helix-turn-helix transcriptional regulator [Convivina intestini]|uniref:MarR family winged helix-turn-helix transcriptional regulator n=1 Tax=Convivina intestini TaxID=1505726 RepID=UPI00200E90FD|nr:MarR family transcriptional regulator [Convivina intestini]CAH1857203.1 hypothetical protein R078131_01557 [Convivina intestini]